MDAVLGVDVGTGSTKGVLVDLGARLLATAVREHRVATPRPGKVEMPVETWWEEFASISRECLTIAGPDAVVRAVGVSGMGPCVAVADDQARPLRPAILYGVEARAVEQICDLTRRLGAEEVVRRTGSALDPGGGAEAGVDRRA